MTKWQAKTQREDKEEKKIKHYSLWKLPGSRQSNVSEFQLRAFQSEIVIVWKGINVLCCFFSLCRARLWGGVSSLAHWNAKGAFWVLWSLPLLSSSLVCEICKGIQQHTLPYPWLAQNGNRGSGRGWAFRFDWMMREESVCVSVYVCLCNKSKWL